MRAHFNKSRAKRLVRKTALRAAFIASTGGFSLGILSGVCIVAGPWIAEAKDGVNWADMMTRFENTGMENCRHDVKVLAHAKPLPLKEKASIVNDYVNEHYPWKDDNLNYGRPEYWASPSEMCGKRSGDCEDNAILKYFLLRKFGVPVERMYIASVDSGGRSNLPWENIVDHAVLLLDVSSGMDGSDFVVLNNWGKLQDARDSGLLFYVSINENSTYDPKQPEFKYTAVVPKAMV